MENKNKALVVFSAGQDSTTCLAWAINKFGEGNVEAITFDYNQRHSVEIEQAKIITQKHNIPHFIHKVGVLGWNKNALTDNSVDIKQTKTVPTSFVPYRNVHFLLIAATYARSRGINNLVTGVCQTDFSGYKDCRDVFIKSFEVMINQADDYQIIIHTPLMWLDKSEEVLMMQELGKLEWLADSHTCYEGKRPACGECPACKLRLKGFKDANIEDPTVYE